MAHIYPYLDLSPQLHTSVFMAHGVCLYGDVRAEAGVSFWCNVVARGDVNTIKIGKNTNIQDLCALHVTEEAPLTLGADITVGHHVMLHGCTIGDRCLIGMGAIILDHAVIGEECLIAAGSLVTQNCQIPAGSLVMGAPAKVKRQLTLDERKHLVYGSESYSKYASNYLKTPGWKKPT